MSLLNYVLYVSLCLTCFRALRVSCPTCSRALRASCPTCSHALRASCSTCSRALRALVPYVPRDLRALVPYVPRVLRAIVLHVPHALLALEPPVLGSSLVSCLMGPHASRFMSPFSLRTLLYRTLRTPCPNIMLLSFYASRSYFSVYVLLVIFWRNLLKLKQI